MELRRVDPRCLKKNPGNPRKIQPGEMSDAALAASIGAIGTVKANRYRRFSASNPAERGGNS